MGTAMAMFEAIFWMIFITSLSLFWRILADRNILERSIIPEDRVIRLVMIGKTGTGKSATGNSIIGAKDAFDEKRTCSSATRVCKKRSVIVNGTVEIQVVDTPGVLDTDRYEGSVEDEIRKCLDLSAPGPHAFIMTLNLCNRFTAEEYRAYEIFKRLFGREILNHIIVCFTHGDQLEGTTVQEMLRRAPVNLKHIMKEVNNRYVVFNNKEVDERNDSQVLKLIRAVRDLLSVRKPFRKLLQRRHVKEQEKTSGAVRLVLLGVTYSGKSATGNSIIGSSDAFETFRGFSGTEDCQQKSIIIGNTEVQVVDTPGVFNFCRPDLDILNEIKQFLRAGGFVLNAFIWVVSLCRRFMNEHYMAYKYTKDILGEDIVNYMIIVFTHGDEVGEWSVEEMLQTAPTNLKEILKEVKNRYVVFNNKTANDETKDTQVLKLLHAVRSMYYCTCAFH